jgi:DNA-binding IclR family transcriptional regulator
MAISDLVSTASGLVAMAYVAVFLALGVRIELLVREHRAPKSTPSAFHMFGQIRFMGFIFGAGHKAIGDRAVTLLVYLARPLTVGAIAIIALQIVQGIQMLVAPASLG